MRTHTQVAVIGGGVVGASVLYHLTKAGWRDVMLIERAELTSGSTWHAAGGMHTVNGDPNVAKLQQYTIGLYEEIERISGQSCGVHVNGGILLAGTPERLDWLKMTQARGRYLGMQLELLSVAEAKKIYPLLDGAHFVGALYDPIEGHVDPYGVTHAYARAAQLAGAEIQRQTRVVDTKARPDGTWDVVSERGTVRAEHVVNAGGLWAREVGRMVGLELPVLAMEHQYLITEDLPEFVGRKDQLHCIDFEGEIYMRQERGGMLIGTYERAGVPWSPRSTPWDFGQDLLPNDLERIAPSLEVAFEHFPRLASAGIRKVVNGPFTFAPDGNPLVGPGAGPRVTTGWPAASWPVSARAAASGSRCRSWMVDGDPGADIWAMDVARYGDWATLAYTNAKVRENYSRRFRIRFPNEELDGGAAAAHHAHLRAAAGAERGVRRVLRLWSTRCGSRPRARRRARSSPFGAPTRIPWSARNAARCATRSDCSRSPTTASSRSTARLPQPGCRPLWPIASRPSAASALAPMLNERGAPDRRFHAVPCGRGSVLPDRHLCGRALLPALVRAPHARLRRHGARLRDGVRRPVGGRTELA